MKWEVTVPATGLPVAWGDLKRHISLDDPGEKDLVMSYAAAAVEHAESLLEMSLMPRTIQAIFWPGDEIALPRPPILEVLSVKDEADADVEYEQRHIGHTARLFPRGSYIMPLYVTYRAGYVSGEFIPADILNAIRVATATLYGFREDLSERPVSSIHKLDDYYRFRGTNASVA